MTWLLIFAMVSVISFLLFFDFGKTDSRTIKEILNFGHFFLFGIAALSLLWILGEKFPAQGTAFYVKAGVITVLFGILSEFIQLLTPDRDFEVQDMAADGFGAIAFLAIVYSCRKGLRTRTRVILRAITSLLTVIMLCPVFSAAVDDYRMKRDFPLLGSFESLLESSRWTAEGTNKMERVNQHATDGEFSLKAVLFSGQYPGVAMAHHIQDWSGYRSLEFDVFSEGNSPRKITVRINDRKHNEQFHDRYNGPVLLQTGPNHISIGLDKVRNAPKGRIMDMAAVTDLCLFTSQVKEPVILYLDNFRLKK